MNIQGRVEVLSKFGMILYLKCRLICMQIHNQTRVIINMLRQSKEAKKLFYKGITLKDYIRGSAVLFVENDNEETLIVDEFNQPLVNIGDFAFWQQNPPQYIKSEAKQLSTKVFTNKSFEQDQDLPQLQIRKPIPNSQNKNAYDLNCPHTIKRRSQVKESHVLPILELTKSRNLKLQNFNTEHVIAKRKATRQKCLASRQVSRQNEESYFQSKNSQEKSMSHRQYVQHVKMGIQQRRNLTLRKSDKQVAKGKKLYFLCRSLTEQK